jgi:hypothetical protein
VENRLKDEASVKCLAEMEHRRWCADKLLTGWRSLAPTPENWNRWKENKKPFQKQKLHIDLVTFDQLFNKDEKLKDDSQIRGIPQFLRNAEKRRQRKSAP